MPPNSSLLRPSQLDLPQVVRVGAAGRFGSPDGVWVAEILEHGWRKFCGQDAQQRQAVVERKLETVLLLDVEQEGCGEGRRPYGERRSSASCKGAGTGHSTMRDASTTA